MLLAACWYSYTLVDGGTGTCWHSYCEQGSKHPAHMLMEDSRIRIQCACPQIKLDLVVVIVDTRKGVMIQLDCATEQTKPGQATLPVVKLSFKASL